MCRTKLGEDSLISKLTQLKIRRRNGVKFLTTDEEGKVQDAD